MTFNLCLLIFILCYKDKVSILKIVEFYITCPPTIPCLSLRRSVWLQALLLHGDTCRRSLSKSKLASWLCRKFLIFQGRSLWPSINGTSDNTCRTVSRRSLVDVRDAISPSAGRGPTLPIQLPSVKVIKVAVHTLLCPPPCKQLNFENFIKIFIILITIH